MAGVAFTSAVRLRLSRRSIRSSVVEQVRHVERLVADRVGPLGEHLLHGLVHLGAMAGDHDRPGLRVRFAAPAGRHWPPSPSGSFMSIRTTRNDVSAQLLGRRPLVVGQADAVAALAQQIPEVGAQVGVVVDDQHQRLANGFVDQAQQLGQIDRLGQDLPGAGVQRLLGGAAAGVGRHHDGHRAGAQLLDLAVERQAVHARHLQVQQGHVVGLLPHQFQGRRAVVGGVDLVAQVGEDVGQVAAGIDLVIDDEDGRRGIVMVSVLLSAAAGSQTVNVLPVPGSLATRKAPRFLSRMARAMASPRPSPRALVE